MRRSLALLMALGMVSIAPGTRADDDMDIGFDDFSLEELTSLQVTSVSKRETKLSDSTSAVHVITREDIRRSGHTFTTVGKTNGHSRFDVRLGWRPIEGLELSLVGLDVFDRRHTEYPGPTSAGGSTHIERSIYGQVVLTF